MGCKYTDKVVCKIQSCSRCSIGQIKDDIEKRTLRAAVDKINVIKNEYLQKADAAFKNGYLSTYRQMMDKVEMADTIIDQLYGEESPQKKFKEFISNRFERKV